MSPDLSPAELVELFALEPLPAEGGLFHQTWVSHRHWPGNDKPAGTAIIMLLTNEADSFSALHRLPTDEVYHFYLGDPLELTELRPAGEFRTVVLGQDLRAGQRVQHVVEAGVWMGSRVAAGAVQGWSLFGTTMAPGFTAEDYEGGDAASLTAAYPAAAERIAALCRLGGPGAISAGPAGPRSGP